MSRVACFIFVNEKGNAKLTMGSRFGIDFAPDIVRADGNVRNLSMRILSAMAVLVSSLAYLPRLGRKKDER